MLIVRHCYYMLIMGLILHQSRPLAARINAFHYTHGVCYCMYIYNRVHIFNLNYSQFILASSCFDIYLIIMFSTYVFTLKIDRRDTGRFGHPINAFDHKII